MSIEWTERFVVLLALCRCALRRSTARFETIHILIRTARKTSAFLFRSSIRRYSSMSIHERISSTSDQLRHRVIFADRESITPNENDAEIKQQWIDIYNENRNEGAVQSNGTISWDCPCLGTQAIGPCSQQFRAAFSCYQFSTQEPKGESHHLPSICSKLT